MKGAWANVRLDISWFGGKISSDLKVKGPDIYIPPPQTHTGKPEQQRFTTQSGVLTSISSRQRSTISGRPLPEKNGLWTRSLQPAALWPSPHDVLQQ